MIPEVQSRLLEFINEALLTELLTDINRFMVLAEFKEA
jgi:hypothetical protein